MQTDRIQGAQRWPIRSLQTKATLLVIAIVGSVLALSSFLNIRVSEHALEWDLHDNAMALARQFASGMGSAEELNSSVTLQFDIGQVMEHRMSISRVEVYAMAQGVPVFVTSSAEQIPGQPGLLGLLGGPRGSAGGDFQWSERARQWNVAAPVHLQGTLVQVVTIK